MAAPYPELPSGQASTSRKAEDGGASKIAFSNLRASGEARQHNGNVYNNHSYTYTVRRRRSDETLRDDQRSNELLKAAAQGHTPRVQHLLRLGADVDLTDENGFTALHRAALSGYEDAVEALLHAGAAVYSDSFECGTALHVAALKARVNVVILLLQWRADPRASSRSLGLPQHCAAFSGSVAISDVLMRAGASLHTPAAVRPFRMHEASSIPVDTATNRAEYPSPVNGKKRAPQLLTVYEVQPFVIAIMLRQAAFLQHVMRSNGFVVDQEVKVWADMPGTLANYPNERRPASHATPLMVCARDGLVDVCNELLQAGASRTARNSYGWNAVMHAALLGHSECIGPLIGPDDQQLPFPPALFLSHSSRDGGGWTPLIGAAYNGHADCIRALVREGVAVDERTVQYPNDGFDKFFDDGLWPHAWSWRLKGLTALHIAIYQNHLECIKVLLEAGARIDVHDEDESTPLRALSTLPAPMREQMYGCVAPYLQRQNRSDILRAASRNFDRHNYEKVPQDDWYQQLPALGHALVFDNRHNPNPQHQRASYEGHLVTVIGANSDYNWFGRVYGRIEVFSVKRAQVTRETDTTKARQILCGS